MDSEVSGDFIVPIANTIKFFLGDIEHTVNAEDIDPSVTLNTYLRDKLHLTATKKMCNEGGCGTCVVAVEETVKGKKNVFAVNSCLVSILSCHGWKINTNEGIGNPLIGLHNIQKLLAANNGTQCGFCSSGMVMNMYALQKSGPLTKEQIENSFGSNLCRCTGYRPILEAFKKLATTTDEIVPDIEDLKICEGEQCKSVCPGCPNHLKRSFCLEFGKTKWIKVLNLANLLYTLKTYNTNNYMLVAGNTARGVYRPTTTPNLFIDISNVAELTTFSVNDTALTLGANITLTTAIRIFDSLSTRTGFAYLGQLRDHLDLVAHVPVRNIGTIAGNLMIKYNHREFPSDVFLLLETFNAIIFIVGVDSTTIQVSPEEFLKLDMTQKVIQGITLRSLDSSYKYNTFKIMARAQNTHAIVNAGFLVKIDANQVTESRIVYGGINPNFIHAKDTESVLKGRNIYDNGTLNNAFKALDGEVVPNSDPPEPSPKYRKQLAIALFYKFILSTAPAELVTSRNASGGTVIERPLSSGIQEFGTQKENWPLSEPVIKLEALNQTSGQAEYIADLPDQHNQLFAAFVTAEVPAGTTIQSTDASEALKMPGIVAYFDEKSIPGQNNVISAALPFTIPEELFCSGTVKHFHQPVGIVVANNHELALKAVQKIKIFYMPPKEKPLLYIQDVLKANATDRITDQTTMVASRTGTDVQHVIKGTWYTKEQHAFHMEVHCCQVIPTEDTLDIYTSTQWIDINQLAAANVLNIPMNQINVFVRRLGGGFGGKLTRNVFISTAAALAAHILKKPVKIWLPLEKNLQMLGSRMPVYVDYEVRVNNSGVIQDMNTEIYSGMGIAGNEYLFLDPIIISLFENCYDISTWNFATNTIRTDMASMTSIRAPASIEGLGAIESIMEHIAYTVNMDTFDVKSNNINATKYPKILEFWNTMQEWGEIAQRKSACKAFNEANRWKKKGMSIAPMHWLFTLQGLYPSLVSIYHLDGSVVVSHGGIEMGQGINTKIAQVTAYKFGIPLDKVRIRPTYNVISPNAWPSGGSLTSESIAYATIQACDVLIARMQPTKDSLVNPTWETLINTCYQNNIYLSASGVSSPNTLVNNEYDIFGLCATEVEVDILTGQYQINRVDLIEDVGDSMSPLIDIGQVEGAFVMGIGYYTTEDVIFDPEGKMLTQRTWNYKPPGAKDIPINFRVKLPERNPNPLGILKSKAIAEPPMCLSVSVPLAIRNAVASARTDANSTADKWFPFDGTTTREQTFLNSLNSYEQYTL